MDNIIKKLGFQWHYWYGLLTPPLFIFGFWFVEDTSIIKPVEKYLEEQIFKGSFSGYLGISIIVFLMGILIPIFVLTKIKCSRCKTRIVWHALNRSKPHRDMQNPFSSPVCPACGYDPSSEIKK